MAVRRIVWKEKFGDWFREILERGKIIDYRYPIKACGVWLPYGFQLRNKILSVIRSHLNETGHKEMLFPSLIPENLIAKESTHIKSFETEAYWVTHGGKKKLSVKLALRPTSETAITPMVKLWVRSHADLPLKIYQIGSIYRYETKATKPLIRVREVTTFKEAHTFHSSHKESKKQVKTANDIYRKIFNEICIPYVISQRPSWDKFAGALATYAFDTILPDGKTLQIGTTHDLGQNFSKAFNFTFETKEGKQEFVWQTSYGISERAIAAVIAVNGDDRGLVLPPKIAPIQVIIVPIIYKGFEAKIVKECHFIKSMLSKEGVYVKIDNRSNITPGSKFYDWELKGVPLRIEIGPKDIEQGNLTLVRRDTGTKISCKRDSLKIILKILDETKTNLKLRAWQWMREHIKKIVSIDEAKRWINMSGGIVEIPWCGLEKCGLHIEVKTEARVLGIPIDSIIEIFGKCPSCGKRGEFIIRIAKAY